MTFTPFHLGPGALFKSVGGRHFSFMVFGGSQVLIELEPLVRILRGDDMLHGFSHTVLGAFLIALVAGLAQRMLTEFSEAKDQYKAAIEAKDKIAANEVKGEMDVLLQVRGDMAAFTRIYVNNVIKGKLLESEELRSQAQNNSKTQFASSPTLSNAILDAVIDAMAAHQNMSSQALESAKVREGLREILLGPGQLYEALRQTGTE